VLLRSDGAPTYNLAVVVDDHDMGVTHVIRGDDHLNNAARQSLIYDALDWPRPVFAHIPLIHGPDGAKLSKRHGAQAVHDYAAMGYLPEAMRNYLARLGWGHGDDELFDDAQAASWFDITDVVSAPARLDWAKLNHINHHYIRLAEIPRLVALTRRVLESRDVVMHDEADALLERTLPNVRDGAKTTLDLADSVMFVIQQRPVALTDKVMGLLNEETRGRLSRLAAHLGTVESWEISELEGAIRSFAESEGVGIGKFGQALRGVLAGTASAPDLAGALFCLGKPESLARLDDALSPAV
jgi:glutamyl-tRNA synthetase